MKIKNIFMSLLAVLFVAVGCSVKNLGPLDEIRVSEDLICLDVKGSTVTVGVNAAGPWEITGSDGDKLPEWVEITPTSGEAGSFSVKFKAAASEISHEDNLEIRCEGAIQHLTVKQGVQSKEFIPLKTISEKGIVGATYYVKAKVAKIDNALFGNLVLEDETGKLNVYGTLNKDGQEAHFADLKIAEGDEIEAHGPFLPHKGTPQLKNITVDKIIKSLVQLDKEMDRFDLEKEAQTVDIKLKVAGDGLVVTPIIESFENDEVQEEPCDWISVNAVNIVDGKGVVTLSINENTGRKPREAVIKIVSSSKEADNTSTVKSIIRQVGNIPPKCDISESFTQEYVQIQGSIVAMCSNGYILKDKTAATFINIYKYDKGNKLGDKMTVCGTPSVYNFAPQIKSPDITDFVEKGTADHGEATELTAARMNELVAAIDGKDKEKDIVVTPEYVKVSGKLTFSGKDNKYTNILVEGTEHDASLYGVDKAEFNLADLKDKDVVVYGYFMQISGSQDPRHFNIVATSVQPLGADQGSKLKITFDEAWAKKNELTLKENYTTEITSVEEPFTLKFTESKIAIYTELRFYDNSKLNIKANGSEKMKSIVFQTTDDKKNLKTTPLVGGGSIVLSGDKYVWTAPAGGASELTIQNGADGTGQTRFSDITIVYE